MEYKGWLTSPNIFKRSLSVWGHFMFGYLIVVLGITIPIYVFIALFG